MFAFLGVFPGPGTMYPELFQHRHVSSPHQVSSPCAAQLCHHHTVQLWMSSPWLLLLAPWKHHCSLESWTMQTPSCSSSQYVLCTCACCCAAGADGTGTELYVNTLLFGREAARLCCAAAYLSDSISSVSDLLVVALHHPGDVCKPCNLASRHGRG